MGALARVLRFAPSRPPRLRDMTSAGSWQPAEPFDLIGPTGRGAIAGIASTDLNANVVAWPEGDGVGEHVNDAVDVLLAVLSGSLTITVDGAAHVLAAGDALLVPKGARRSITAAPGGVRYLTCHRARPPLQIS